MENMDLNSKEKHDYWVSRFWAVETNEQEKSKRCVAIL